MRLYAAALLGLTIASAAEARTNPNADSPAGQTLLNGLIGKNQTAPSGKATLGETREQHDHYINKGPANQHITSDSVRSDTDN